MDLPRRSFIKSTLAVGAGCLIPGITGKAHDWYMVVGGNRSGKSTIGEIECLRYARPFILSYDERSLDYLKRAFLIDHATLLSSKSFYEHVKNDDIHGEFLWVDETIMSPKLHLLAKKFKRVLWTTFPHRSIPSTEFYKTCLANGTVKHLAMRPEFRERFEEYLGNVDADYKSRVLGHFA